MGKAAVKLLARAALSQDLSGSRGSASKVVAVGKRPQFLTRWASPWGYSRQGFPLCE